MALGAETEVMRDRGTGLIREFEQILRSLDFFAENILLDRHAGFLMKEFG